MYANITLFDLSKNYGRVKKYRLSDRTIEILKAKLVVSLQI